MKESGEWKDWPAEKPRKCLVSTGKKPKISVCIPTYNYGSYITDAIDSVLAQSFTEYELIVVDNCSTDETAVLVEKYLGKDPRIKFIRNDSNIGMVENWNKCLALATGEYVKILCADDVLAASCLEKSMDIFAAEPDVALVSCARSIVDRGLNALTTRAYSAHSEVIDGGRAVDRCLTYGVNFIGEPSAVIFKREHASRGFNFRYRQLVDLEMWFFLLKSGRYAYINEALCSVRLHEQQQTKSNLLQLHHLDEPFLLLRDYLDFPPFGISRFKKAFIAYITAYRVLKLGIPVSTAVKKIQERYGIIKMIVLYPYYKFYKWFLRLSSLMRGI